MQTGWGEVGKRISLDWVLPDQHANDYYCRYSQGGNQETSRGICHSSNSMSHNDYSLYFGSLVLQLISDRAEEVCARRWEATVMSQKQIRESFRCPASLSTPCSFTFLLFCFSHPPSKNNYRWLGGDGGNDLSAEAMPSTARSPSVRPPMLFPVILPWTVKRQHARILKFINPSAIKVITSCVRRPRVRVNASRLWACVRAVWPPDSPHSWRFGRCSLTGK